MKKVLLATTCLVLLPTTTISRAKAEDGPTWTGAYFGVNAGGLSAKGKSSIEDFPPMSFVGADPAVPSSAKLNASGFIGGGQIGYNYQFGNVVFGIEDDFSFAGISGASATSGTIRLASTPFTLTEKQTLDWIGTLRARLGVKPADRLLVYGTGGIAYGRVKTSTNLSFPTQAFVGSDSSVRVGGTAGMGLEYALPYGLTARMEYLYVDLGSATVVGFPVPPNPPFETHTRFDLTSHVLRVGLNYNFGFMPATEPTDRSGNVLGTLVPQKQFSLELGGRYFFSTGRTKKNLFIPDGSAEISRLTYSGLDAHSGELFYRGDFSFGAFLKGYAGLGDVTGGRLKDEDFEPFIVPASATLSDQKGGHISYVSVDLGYDFLTRQSYRLGAFAGYHYYNERLNAFGCTQVGANPFICVPSLPGSIIGITNDDTWHSVRLGLAADVLFGDQLKLNADAAYLPYMWLTGQDDHWLRIGSDFAGPIPESGTGHNGYQLETVLTYQATPGFSIGVGGRYWHLQTSAAAHFEIAAIGGGAPQPIKIKTDRYGGFVQAAFKF